LLDIWSELSTNGISETYAELVKSKIYKSNPEVTAIFDMIDDWMFDNCNFK
jgi:hypothetical protein